MKMLSRICLVALTFGCVVFPRPAAPQTTADNDAMRHFTRNVSAYVVIRQRAASSVPALRVTSDPARLERAESDLANAIRAARSNARQGDIFSPDIANALRRRLTTAIHQHALTASRIAAKIDDDVTNIKKPLVVNGRLVWNRGSEMPVEILHALPDLPAGLEYSFVGRTLVLVDVDADLVVDFLPNAL